MPPVIRLDKLTKRFGAETALDQVSLEVPPGVVFALLGENGAGKTTAIRIMLGLAEPDSGQAEVLGLSSATQGLQIRQRVGYVPERPTLYDWMTVEEIGWFTAGFYGAGFLPEYVRLVAQFGLPAEEEAQSALQRHAGEGGALAGAGRISRSCWSSTSRPPAWTPWCAASSWRAWSIGPRKAKPCSSPAIRSARWSGWPTSWPSSARENCCWSRPLDELKAQVRRLTVTLKDGAAAPPDIGGEILSPAVEAAAMAGHSPRRGRGAGCGAPAAIEAVDDVEVHPANLEDIFVAYMQAGNGHDGDCPNFRGHRGEAVVGENGTVPFDGRTRQGEKEDAQP